MKNSDILKGITKIIFFTGGGDHWHEERKMSFPISTLYKIMWISLYTYFLGVIFSQLLASIYGDFTGSQKSDILSFVVAQAITLVKILCFLFNRKLVKQLNYDMVKVCEEYEQESVMKMQYRKIKIYSFLYFATVYVVVFNVILDGLVRMYSENVPFVTLALYWPEVTDSSILASLIRGLIPVAWVSIMMLMISTDLTFVTHLIMLAYKFKTLRMYFESIRTSFNLVDQKGLKKYEEIDELRHLCLKGILMHQELLRLAVVIRDAFGLMMSLQVCQSSFTTIFLLMRSVTSSDAIVILKTGIFIICLLIMLAQVLWNAGDATYEASLLPNAIFHCGWHVCGDSPGLRDIRRLVLFSCARAQRTLVFKAFGISDLSYETYVSVVKATYSVFAVFAGR